MYSELVMLIPFNFAIEFSSVGFSGFVPMKYSECPPIVKCFRAIKRKILKRKSFFFSSQSNLLDHFHFVHQNIKKMLLKNLL